MKTSRPSTPSRRSITVAASRNGGEPASRSAIGHQRTGGGLPIPVGGRVVDRRVHVRAAAGTVPVPPNGRRRRGEPQSACPLGEQLLALEFVQPAPDAVRLPNAHGIVETVLANGAGACRSPWRAAHARSSPPCARTAAGGRRRPPAVHDMPPSACHVLFNALSAQLACPLFARRPYNRPFRRNKGELL